jgi:hypothetical protein
MSYGRHRRAGTDALIPRGAKGSILLTPHLPKPTLAASGIRALMVPLGQLGHEAKAASSGRTQVGGDSRG